MRYSITQILTLHAAAYHNRQKTDWMHHSHFIVAFSCNQKYPDWTLADDQWNASLVNYQRNWRGQTTDFDSEDDYRRVCLVYLVNDPIFRNI